jgi:hypothetical protein
MVAYQIVIQKALGTEYWVNDYHVDVASFDAARTAGQQIAAIERDNSHGQVSFINYRVKIVSDIITQGTIFPLGYNGTGGDYEYLPLFNVIRVDMAPDQGRPGRKYYKLPVPEGGQSNGQLTTATITNVNNGLCLPLLNLGVLCKSNGDNFTSIACNPRVGMRQLRRGSRRRQTPVI